FLELLYDSDDCTVGAVAVEVQSPLTVKTGPALPVLHSTLKLYGQLRIAICLIDVNRSMPIL
ncbi:hypothetical protein SFRURICE_010934, partial [Spodoptera frugiperda]